MWRTLLAALLILWQAQASSANFASFQVNGPGIATPDVICDVTTGVATGVGAGTCASTPLTCDGVTDDSPGVITLNNWAVNTWQASHTGLIEFFIPSGKTCNFAGNNVICGIGTSANANCPFINIKKFVVVGYGSTVTGVHIDSFAGVGEFHDNLHDVRTQQANVGDSCVTLITTPQQTITGVTFVSQTSVTGATNNGGKVRLAVGSTTGFVTGQYVNITGIVGTTEANGLNKSTVFDATHLDLPDVSFVNAWVSGGTVNEGTKLTVASTAGFTTGQRIRITGTGGVNFLNGGYKQITVLDGTHLSTPVAMNGSWTGTGTIGDYSGIYTVGQYAMMAGFDMQGILGFGGFGYPISNFYFNYVKIVSVNLGTGVVCFDAALTETYLTTWPIYDYGDNDIGGVGTDQGGPATLYALDPSWDVDGELRGLTVDRPLAQSYMKGRKAVLRDVTMTGEACLVPTENGDFQVITSDYSTCDGVGSGFEIDKMIGTVEFTGGTIWGAQFQTSMPNVFTISGTTILHKIVGTPKKFIGTNLTIPEFQLGANAFGRTNEVVCTNCNIGLLSQQSVRVGPDASNSGVNIQWSMAGDTITIPNIWSFNNVRNPINWAIPGTNIMWSGTSSSELLTQVSTVTQDATNTYVKLATSYGGGTWPAVPFSGGKLFIIVHPAPKFTCTGCTGAAGSLAALWPAAAPVYSYQTFTYGGAQSGANFGQFIMWGNLSSLSINVTTAYTGAGSLAFNLSQFGNWNVLESAPTYTEVNYGPAVNAKVAGNRVITLSGVTGTQSGDGGLAVPDAVQTWFQQQAQSAPQYSADVSASCPGAGCPSITVIMQTNQGVVNP